jgi:hypothetical protein
VRTLQQNLKRAYLASSLGAGVLGGGLALLLAVALRRYAVPILLLGLLVHGWGMLDARRLERRAGDVPVWWAEAFYWFCWAALAGLALWVVATWPGQAIAGPWID